MSGSDSGYRIGVDVGGTFTDIVLFGHPAGDVSVAKVLNLHPDRAETVAEGIARLLERTGIRPDRLEAIGHGTTIATNAVIERKGAKTALITNDGFRDVLEIGRFARPERLIYRIHEDKPAPLVPRHLRLGVACRIDRNGEIVTELDESGLERAIAEISREAVESVAVCFLFSFLNPVHEERARSRLGNALPEIEIILSSDILREFREFPRSATTVFAAYVAPVLRSYIASLVERISRLGTRCPVHVFQSNGGVARPEVVMRNPALTLLSGPAGAVAGAVRLCDQIGRRDLVTMDMGGTSLDVSLICDAAAEVTTTREIDMFPVALPMLDIRTIGAGGGSVVRVDEVGRLKIGPDSVGAVPGPACYALGGDRATLTDTNLLMGLLDPETFADGAIRLDRGRAEEAVSGRIAAPLSVDVETAAAGVYGVATNQIAEAIGAMAIERGLDLRDFALVAFGGGGPLHAAAVARQLGILRVVVPRHPGLFSARGIAAADFSHDYVQSIVRPLADISMAEILSAIAGLAERAAADLDAERIGEERRALRPALDLRYVGQATEIAVPLGDGIGPSTVTLAEIAERFHRRHARLYSYMVPDEPIELVNARLRAVGRVDKPLPHRPMEAGPTPEAVGERNVRLPGADRARPVPVYRRDRLARGAGPAGPAIVEESSSSTLVLPEMETSVDRYGNFVVTLSPEGRPP